MNVFVLCWNNSRTGLESFWIIRDAFESNKSSSRRESKILFWTNVIHSHLFCIRSKKTYLKTSITSIILTSLFTDWMVLYKTRNRLWKNAQQKNDFPEFWNPYVRETRGDFFVGLKIRIWSFERETCWVITVQDWEMVWTEISFGTLKCSN